MVIIDSKPVIHQLLCSVEYNAVLRGHLLVTSRNQLLYPITLNGRPLCTSLHYQENLDDNISGKKCIDTVAYGLWRNLIIAASRGLLVTCLHTAFLLHFDIIGIGLHAYL